MSKELEDMWACQWHCVMESGFNSLRHLLAFWEREDVLMVGFYVQQGKIAYTVAMRMG
jgi:hypothetical protein